MRIEWYIILMLTIFLPVHLSGQNWSEQDSVWLSGILSGKDTIRINPEFQKMIREGTFLHREDEPGQQILEAPAELPILKDFSAYLRADTDSLPKGLDHKSIPPSVYRLHIIQLDTALRINKEAYTPPPTRLIDKREIGVGKLPLTTAAGARNLYSDAVKDGQKRGTLGGSVTVYFSLNDVFQWVFSKKERNKRKNRKRENTWRYYNSMP